jgi:hypothetical protein
MRWEPKTIVGFTESYQAVTATAEKLPHWIFKHGSKYLWRVIDPSGACAVGDSPSFPSFDTLSAAQAAALSHAGKYYVV